MPRSYSRSPARSGKSDRKDKYTTRRRSRSKSRDYDKYHRKDSAKHRRRERSKSRSIASSSSHAKSSSYRDRSRDRKYKETSRKSSSSRDRYRRRKSNDRERYRRTSSSSSSSSSSGTSSSRSSDSESSSQSSKKSSPVVKSTKGTPEKEYVFKSLEETCDEPAEKATKLQKLNADEFVPQTFVSSRKPPTSNSAASTNIVIDLESQIIKVPTVDKPVSEEDPIFHPMFFPGDDSERMARWVKRLHNLRQTLV